MRCSRSPAANRPAPSTNRSTLPDVIRPMMKTPSRIAIVEEIIHRHDGIPYDEAEVLNRIDFVALSLRDVLERRDDAVIQDHESTDGRYRERQDRHRHTESDPEAERPGGQYGAQHG